MTKAQLRANITIAGAGIAGLSTAIALAQAGFEVEVFEKAEALLPNGAGIQLGPNATRVLSELGVNVSPQANEPESLQIRAARTGAILNSFPLGQSMRDRYGAGYLTLLRADLQSALLSRAQALNIRLRLGTPITDFAETRTHIVPRFSESEKHSDALIIADGIQSNLKALIAGTQRAGYTHARAFRALLPARVFAAPLRQVVTLWMAPHCHLVHYPVQGGAFLNAVFVAEDTAFQTPLANNDIVPVSILLMLAENWDRAVCEALNAADTWQAWPIYHAAPGGISGTRRIQITGDAWHGMRPYIASGAAMALEDASVMGRVFSQSPSVARALYLFRLERANRVRRVAHESAKMGRVYHLTQPYAAVRDMRLRVMSSDAFFKRNAWLYSWRA